MNMPKKLFIVILVLLTIVQSAFPQSKVSAWATMLMVQQQAAVGPGRRAAADDITLVIETKEEHARQTFDEIRAAGAVVLSKLGQQAVVSIALDKVADLERIDGVTSIDGIHQAELQTDISRVETGVNQIDGSLTGEPGYTGSGITIILLDHGFDFGHRAFKDKDGKSRIRCVYIPSDERGKKFSYDDPEAGTIVMPGSIYDTPELISGLTTDDAAYAHGTSTASVAAGSISPQGYGGMAPDADIVLVSLYQAENAAGVETAIHFAAQYAKLLQTPTVVNGSINSHMGPHNGTSTVCRAINELSNYAIPVFATGNDGNGYRHIHKLLTSDDPVMYAQLQKTFSVAEDYSLQPMIVSAIYGTTRKAFSTEGKLSLQVLLKNDATEQVLWQSPVFIPDNENVSEMMINIADGTEAGEALKDYLKDGFIQMVAARESDGRMTFLLYVSVNCVLDVSDVDKFPLVASITSDADFDVDLWELTQGFLTIKKEGYPLPDNSMSGGDFTTTEKCISVGSYVANLVFRKPDGTDFDTSFLHRYELGEIVETSSWGEYTNGVTQPTVCAPGQYIMSAGSRYDTSVGPVAESRLWEDSPYLASSGTSVAAPTVSGIIALWLQAKPDMVLDEVKQVLANTSVRDSFYDIDPHHWGFGKINAAQGIAYLTGSSGVEEINLDAKAFSPSENADGWFTLDGRRLAVSSHSSPSPAIPKGIYLHGKKKVVIK